MTKEELLQHAFEAMEHAYVPYSHYRVGACVLLRDGVIVKSANIVNASFGLTNCAERSALFAAYSAGYRKRDIKALAIVSEGAYLAAPCGAGRQVIVELMEEDTPIYLSNGKEVVSTTIKELLPMSFTEKDVL